MQIKNDFFFLCEVATVRLSTFPEAGFLLAPTLNLLPPALPALKGNDTIRQDSKSLSACSMPVFGTADILSYASECIMHL